MLIEITVAVMLLKDQEAGRTDDEQARGSGGRRNRRSTARIPRACWLAQGQRGGVVTLAVLTSSLTFPLEPGGTAS